MAADRRNLLQVLKAELDFLQADGYEKAAKTSWRPPFIFEDSPSCLNFNAPMRRHSCLACSLIELVPVNCKGRQMPCRYIPLNAEGETLDSLYRTATAEEIETTVAKWLKAQIQAREEATPHSLV
jgi:hypothetical protein